jgi:PepSY-associated TM region
MQVQFGPPPGTRRANPNLNTGKTAFVDPVSLKILGDTERRRAGAFRRTLTTLHVAMMAPGYFGLQFVGWMGVVMVPFGISGLVLWWPKKGQWRLAFGVKKGTRGFRLNRDLHGAAGFWSLSVFLVLSISGVDLAFPVTFQNMLDAFLPLDSGVADGTLDEATIASIANRNALTVDDAAKLALAAVLSYAVRPQLLPQHRSGGAAEAHNNDLPRAGPGWPASTRPPSVSCQPTKYRSVSQPLQNSPAFRARGLASSRYGLANRRLDSPAFVRPVSHIRARFLDQILSFSISRPWFPIWRPRMHDCWRVRAGKRSQPTVRSCCPLSILLLHVTYGLRAREVSRRFRGTKRT